MPSGQSGIVDCSSLSRRRCQQHSECYYHEYAQWCVSVDNLNFYHEAYQEDVEDDYPEYDPYGYEDEVYQKEFGDDYSDYDPDEYDYWTR